MNVDQGYAMPPPSSPLFVVWRCVLLVLALVGNTLVIVVFLRVPRLRTLTSYFIISLAFADLTTAVTTVPSLFPVPGLPGDLRGALYCRLVASGVLMWTALKASVFNLVAVTSERYLAVVYPLRHKRLFNPARAKLCIAATWAAAVAINLFAVLVFDVAPGGGECVVAWGSAAQRLSVGVPVFLLTYLIPVLLMLATYTRILAKLRTQARVASTQPSRRAHSRNRLLAYHAARRGVVETLFLVVLAFAVCWTPDQVMFLAQNAGHLDYEASAIYPYFLLLALTNSCLNPLIYSLKNRSFRRSIGQAFRGRHRVGQDLSHPGRREAVALHVLNDAEHEKLACTDAGSQRGPGAVSRAAGISDQPTGH